MCKDRLVGAAKPYAIRVIWKKPSLKPFKNMLSRCTCKCRQALSDAANKAKNFCVKIDLMGKHNSVC